MLNQSPKAHIFCHELPLSIAWFGEFGADGAFGMATRPEVAFHLRRFTTACTRWIEISDLSAIARC
jgi:hypothetical protein